jgi:hypothetical protein
MCLTKKLLRLQAIEYGGLYGRDTEDADVLWSQDEALFAGTPSSSGLQTPLVCYGLALGAQRLSFVSSGPASSSSLL